jgi:large subunit ribosomal protein L28
MEARYTALAMPRVCHFTGVRTKTGNKLRHRGRAKHLGGVGTKVTSCTRRTFKPNLQVVSALVDGKPKRIKVSTRAIRQGLVVKPLKRKYAYTRKQQAETAG